MGKQINYYIGYKEFLLVAQAALDNGCVIYRNSFNNGEWQLSSGTDIKIINEKCNSYIFYLPNTNEYIQGSDNARLNSIQAGFSIPQNHIIYKNRLYLETGLYNKYGEYIYRSEEITKIYNKLVCIVKKIAPYTEVEHFVLNTLYEGQKFKSKKYITDEYLVMVQNEDYILG
ncbi:MAG: hypothetical protein J5999_01080 [Oscillospiraceae bacterium]|nr:hypothetical protein [Oscillospiraceae bacterium]